MTEVDSLVAAGAATALAAATAAVAAALATIAHRDLRRAADYFIHGKLLSD